jgi:hypothetical protein
VARRPVHRRAETFTRYQSVFVRVTVKQQAIKRGFDIAQAIIAFG